MAAAAVMRPAPAVHRRSRSAPYFASPVPPIHVPAMPAVPAIAIQEPWMFDSAAPQPNTLSSELGTVLRALGQDAAKADLQDLVRDFGIADSLGPEVDEFLVAMGGSPRLSAAEVEAELRQAFSVFDRDGNGAISGEELRHVMMSIGECLTDEEIEAMMREADLDGDGAIDCTLRLHAAILGFEADH